MSPYTGKNVGPRQWLLFTVVLPLAAWSLLAWGCSVRPYKTVHFYYVCFSGDELTMHFLVEEGTAKSIRGPHPQASKEPTVYRDLRFVYELKSESKVVQPKIYEAVLTSSDANSILEYQFQKKGIPCLGSRPQCKEVEKLELADSEWENCHAGENNRGEPVFLLGDFITRSGQIIDAEGRVHNVPVTLTPWTIWDPKKCQIISIDRTITGSFEVYPVAIEVWDYCNGDVSRIDLENPSGY